MPWQKECGNCAWKNDGRKTHCHICGAKLEDTPGQHHGNSHGPCRICGMKIENGVNHRKWCRPKRKTNEQPDDAYWKDRLRGKPEKEVLGVFRGIPRLCSAVRSP